MIRPRIFLVILFAEISFCVAFQTPATRTGGRLAYRDPASSSSLSSSSLDSNANDDPLKSLVTARLPTSVDDQVRQCVLSIQKASAPENQNRVVRHCVRLLLPVIGATDLDDWPGGTRQMMESAAPLVDSIMAGLGIPNSNNNNNIQKLCLDESDSVYAWLGQAPEAKDDCVFVLLPTAECLDSLKQLEAQVGPKRNLVLVNPQWRRRSDFGGVFGIHRQASASYVEGYQPTFFLSNFICEGESVRVLHTHGSGVWRVYVRKNLNNGDVAWDLLGEKPYQTVKPSNWEQLPGNDRDGGRLFDYGQPSYADITAMLNNSPNYTPKNPAERAAAAFAFIKDTL